MNPITKQPYGQQPRGTPRAETTFVASGLQPQTPITSKSSRPPNRQPGSDPPPPGRPAATPVADMEQWVFRRVHGTHGRTRDSAARSAQVYGISRIPTVLPTKSGEKASGKISSRFFQPRSRPPPAMAAASHSSEPLATPPPTPHLEFANFRFTGLQSVSRPHPAPGSPHKRKSSSSSEQLRRRFGRPLQP